MTITKPLFIAAIIGLSACATSSDSEEKPRGVAAFKDDVRLGEKVERICFNRNIDGFSDNQRDTVVLSAGVSKDYLVSVRGLCPSLRHAQSVAIDTSLSCVRHNDILIVSESAFSLNDGTGRGPDRCFIDEIYKWDKKAEEKADMSETP